MKVDKVHKKFTPAVEPYRIPRVPSTQRAVVSNQDSQAPLAAFFKTYNFKNYIYNPSNPPTEEFTRLCTARQWGPAKVGASRVLFDNTLLLTSYGQQQLPATQNTNPQLSNFFLKYEFVGFSYNPAASVESEFQRMCEARKWGERNLKKVTTEFKEALNSGPAHRQPISESSSDEGTPPNHTPISAFLIRQNCPGYTYSCRSPEIEFQALVSIKEREWKLSRGQNERYRKSQEFFELRGEFNAAIEEQFDWLLKVERGSTEEKELRPWEILVELFGVGKAPISRENAGRVLKEVYVNIFDFIDFLEKVRVTNPGTQGIQGTTGSSSELAMGLKFPNTMLLGVYSVLSKRVYALEDARENGTLVLLLHRIGRYFGPFEDILKAFEDEAGDNLTRARIEGPPGIRKLLLSRRWRSLSSLRG